MPAHSSHHHRWTLKSIQYPASTAVVRKIGCPSGSERESGVCDMLRRAGLAQEVALHLVPGVKRCVAGGPMTESASICQCDV